MRSKKLTLLRQNINELQKCAVAFSGGADSAFLLKTVSDILGNNLLAVTVKTPFMGRKDVTDAKSFTREHGIQHVIINVNLPASCWKNPRERCYLCKKALFREILREAKKRGYRQVVEASQNNDTKDYRPGMKALKELKIKSPLLEAGITKKEIRRFSKNLGLKTALKDASPCLATRIPCREKITEEKLRRIEKAEDYLKKYRLKNLRVRSIDQTARIEVDPKDIPRVVAHKEKIIKRLKKDGFTNVAIDLEGYRKGSMNKG